MVGGHSAAERSERERAARVAACTQGPADAESPLLHHRIAVERAGAPLPAVRSTLRAASRRADDTERRDG